MSFKNVCTCMYVTWYFGWKAHSGKHNFVVLSYFLLCLSTSMKLGAGLHVLYTVHVSDHTAHVREYTLNHLALYY